MAADVDVVTPWRSSEERVAPFQFVRRWWGGAGVRVVTGELPSGPWRKAVAIHKAVLRSTADVVAVADADVVCDPEDLLIASRIVADGDAGWASPYTDVVRLTDEASRQVMATGVLPSEDQQGIYDEKPYRGRLGGGIVVIRRDQWDRTPMDPAFVGWGHEDEAWGKVLKARLGQPWRAGRPLWHLWHPPQKRRSRGIGSSESLALCHQYLVSSYHDDELNALLDQARAELHSVA